MKNGELATCDATRSEEIARQAGVELAIILGMEQSLRMALQWMTRDRGNSHKLSTLRFQAWSFERHLARIQVLADHGGYMHLIEDANPHLVGEIGKLRHKHTELHAVLERIIFQLDHASRDDASGFGQICANLERFLDDLRTLGEKESDLLQHSFAQEEGGSG